MQPGVPQRRAIADGRVFMPRSPIRFGTQAPLSAECALGGFVAPSREVLLLEGGGGGEWEEVAETPPDPKGGGRAHASCT
jgi:hypothetical protein